MNPNYIDPRPRPSIAIDPSKDDNLMDVDTPESGGAETPELHENDGEVLGDDSERVGQSTRHNVEEYDEGVVLDENTMPEQTAEAEDAAPDHTETLEQTAEAEDAAPDHTETLVAAPQTAAVALT